MTSPFAQTACGRANGVTTRADPRRPPMAKIHKHKRTYARLVIRILKSVGCIARHPLALTQQWRYIFILSRFRNEILDADNSFQSLFPSLLLFLLVLSLHIFRVRFRRANVLSDDAVLQALQFLLP